MFKFNGKKYGHKGHEPLPILPTSFTFSSWLPSDLCLKLCDVVGDFSVVLTKLHIHSTLLKSLKSEFWMALLEPEQPAKDPNSSLDESFKQLKATGGIEIKKSEDMNAAILIQFFKVAYNRDFLGQLDIDDVLKLSRFCFKYDAPTILDLCLQKLNDFVDLNLSNQDASWTYKQQVELLLVAQDCKMDSLFDTVFNHESFKFLLTQDTAQDDIKRLADGLQNMENLRKLTTWTFSLYRTTAKKYVRPVFFAIFVCDN